MDSSDTSEDSFMQTSSRKWAQVHPASLLGNKTPADDEDYEHSDNQ